MTYSDGEITPDSTEVWLNRTLEYGTQYWGDDITERDTTGIHQFYEPFAESLSDLEKELQQVLQALRIQEAEGVALDLLGGRLGVSRITTRAATGEVTFSSDSAVSKDYLIQGGTTVKTSPPGEIEFETTEEAVLESGTSSVTAPVQALEEGSIGNVAADTITEATVFPPGVDSITNQNATSGGRDREQDDPYRQRIQKSVGDVETTSGYHLYNTLKPRSFVKEIRFLDNSSDSVSNGLDPHQFEVVVAAEDGHKDEIAQVIFENMPMGSNIVGGVHGTEVTGTAELPNGQTFTIPYSSPTSVSIYVTLEITEENDVDKSQIKDNIVSYIGGVKTSGTKVYGDLSVEEDVIYGEVEYQIREATGVYDVPTLEIDTSDPPSGTSNITISQNQVAEIDHADIDITVV